VRILTGRVDPERVQLSHPSPDKKKTVTLIAKTVLSLLFVSLQQLKKSTKENEI